MTILDSIYQQLLDFTGSMSPAGVHFWIQMGLLTLLPCALCTWGEQQTKTPVLGIQISLCALGMLAALALPVHRLEIEQPAARLWLITVCILVAMFGPVLLGYRIVTEAGAQKKTIRILYVVIVVLSIWQFAGEA